MYNTLVDSKVRHIFAGKARRHRLERQLRKHSKYKSQRDNSSSSVQAQFKLFRHCDFVIGTICRCNAIRQTHLSSNKTASESGYAGKYVISRHRLGCHEF